MKFKRKVKLFMQKLKMLLWYRYVHRLVTQKYSGYSQSDEDVFIAEFFAGQTEGVYVDIGCFHPVKYSNTYGLYMKGWRGVNIDMSPYSISLFDLARPRDVNICAACSGSVKAQKAYMYTRGSERAVNTLDENHFKWLKSVNLACDSSFSEVTVMTSTFDMLLKDHVGLGVDLLSIDAEGSDFDILCSIDLNHYCPKLICIEQFESDVNPHIAPIENYLAPHGYKIVKRLGHSVFYSRCVRYKTLQVGSSV